MKVARSKAGTGKTKVQPVQNRLIRRGSLIAELILLLPLSGLAARLQHVFTIKLAILFRRGVVPFPEDRIEILQGRITAHLRDFIDIE